MDEDDREKIAEILEESRRLRKNMNWLYIIMLGQASTIIGMSYRIYRLENILVKINVSLSDLIEVTGGYHDIFVELSNFLKRALAIIFI